MFDFSKGLFSKYIDITPKCFSYGSNLTVAKLTKDRKYIKTLARVWYKITKKGKRLLKKVGI